MASTFKLQYARILWDRENGNVIINDIRERIKPNEDLPQSGGACWAAWGNAKPADRHGMMMEMVFELLEDGVHPHTLQDEMSKIIEFNRGIFMGRAPTYCS